MWYDYNVDPEWHLFYVYGKFIGEDTRLLIDASQMVRPLIEVTRMNLGVGKSFRLAETLAVSTASVVGYNQAQGFNFPYNGTGIF